MSTKKLSDRDNARCFASSFRQSEIIRTKLENNEEKRTNNDGEPTNDLKVEAKDECSKNSEEKTEERYQFKHRLRPRKTLKSLSWKTPMKTLTQLKVNKIGSNI